MMRMYMNIMNVPMTRPRETWIYCWQSWIFNQKGWSPPPKKLGVHQLTLNSHYQHHQHLISEVFGPILGTPCDTIKSAERRGTPERPGPDPGSNRVSKSWLQWPQMAPDSSHFITNTRVIHISWIRMYQNVSPQSTLQFPMFFDFKFFVVKMPVILYCLSVLISACLHFLMVQIVIFNGNIRSFDD